MANNKVVEKRNMDKLASDYVMLDAEIKAKEKVLKRWRAQLETYMIGSSTLMLKTKKGVIEILEQNRASVSARYTTYEYESLLKLVTPDIADQCVVSRVDRELVEGLVKAKVIPKTIEDHKTLLISEIFSVKCLVPVEIILPSTTSDQAKAQ
jgi:hypothetical protein